MKRYELTKEDYEDVYNLLTITEQVKNIFNKLAELESKNQKDTDYLIFSEKLQELLKEEKKGYQKIGSNIYKISAIIIWLVKFDQPDFSDILSLVFDGNDKDLIIARVVQKLDLILKLKKDDLHLNDDTDLEDEYVDDEEIKNLVEASLPKFKNPEQIEAEYIATAKVEMAIESDIIHTILLILNSYLNKPQYEHLSKYMVNFKYNIVFAFADYLNDYLDNDFTPEKNLYWNSTIIAQLNNVDDLEEIKRDYGTEILYDQIENIMQLFFTTDNEAIAKFILSQIIIRVALQIVEKEDVNKFKSFLQEEMASFSEPIDQNIKKEIENVFTQFLEDRKLVNILTLKLN